MLNVLRYIDSVRHFNEKSPLVYGNEKDTPSPLQPINERLLIRKFKGTRGKSVCLERFFLDRQTKKRGREVEAVSSPARIKKLKGELPVEYETFIDMKDSPQWRLLGALSKAIFDHDDSCPAGMEPDEWRFNLKRAKQLMREKGVRNGQRDQLGIATAILPPRRRVNGRLKRIICGWCRRPILFGYMLTVTR